jgi:hypothetical protein
MFIGPIHGICAVSVPSSRSLPHAAVKLTMSPALQGLTPHNMQLRQSINSGMQRREDFIAADASSTNGVQRKMASRRQAALTTAECSAFNR